MTMFTKYFSWIVLAGMFLAMASYFSLTEDENYNSLNKEWQMKAISKSSDRDPRSDTDQLRPVLNYDGGIIQVHGYKKEKQGSPVGEGWQLAGAVVDIIVHEETKYILYGRNNLYYKAGLWNNVLDSVKSFQDYLVVKRNGDHSEVLINNRLVPTTSQILIGLRLSKDSEGFEVIQNSIGLPQIIWSFRFKGKSQIHP